MAEYEFTLVIEGPVDDDAVLDKLYEAGCSDATFGTADAVGYADFHREARSFAEAVMSAIRDVESIPGLRVRRTEPDDLVTMAEIAERLGRSRESVRLLVAGQRGRGDFPPPVSHFRSRSKLWRWTEVAQWAGVGSDEEHRTARVIATLNAALDFRRHIAELPDRQRSLVEALSG